MALWSVLRIIGSSSSPKEVNTYIPLATSPHSVPTPEYTINTTKVSSTDTKRMVPYFEPIDPG